MTNVESRNRTIHIQSSGTGHGRKDPHHASMAPTMPAYEFPYNWWINSEAPDGVEKLEPLVGCPCATL